MNPTDQPIDLRSDTVTRPCSGMREAMASASVGDDVYGDDPTVNQLQQKLAELLGKEAALFLPSGTQSNLSAVMAHCDRGQEYIIGDQYHVYKYEALGTSVLGSVAPCPIRTQPDGTVRAEDVAGAIKPDDAHFPVTRLLCLENTVSGKALRLEQLQAPVKVAREAGLKVHLDGARFFNATTALNVEPSALADIADTVSVCLSKGLGAPIGSVLVGDRVTIARAHRIRKMLGGGMRQAGVLAAAGLFALENNIAGLARDHERATWLCNELNQLSPLWLAPATARTNMVFVCPQPGLTARLFDHLRQHGLLTGRAGPVVRLVVHKDLDEPKLGRALAAFKDFTV